MNLQQVAPIFILFSGERDTAKFQPLLRSAVLEVRAMLRADADVSDERLTYLAAAIANLRHSQMLCAQQTKLYTAAGSVPKSDGSGNRPVFAQALRDAYLRAAAPLLRDDSFLFAAVGKEADESRPPIQKYLICNRKVV